jgi:hypothetical protein
MEGLCPTGMVQVDHDIFLTNEKSIEKMTPALEIVHIANIPGNGNAAGIAINEVGELLVCMPDMNCLLVLSQSGKLLRTVGLELPVGTCLTATDRVAINGNGDICVVAKKPGRVIIMDSSGRNIRATYAGPPDSTFLNKKFDPRDVCCDTYGHILVSDSDNNCVHLLDGDGRFLQLLLTETDGLTSPGNMALDPAGHLWVDYGVFHEVHYVHTEYSCNVYSYI